MTFDTIMPLFAIGLGVVLALAMLTLISSMLLTAISPHWRAARNMCVVLDRRLGLRTRIIGVDEIGIVRLGVMNDFPVAQRMKDIKVVLNRDVRLETDKKQRPVVAVLPPDKGIRKPAKPAVNPAAPQVVPQPTSA